MISVIIPIYNGESTIEDCLASLCRQTFMPLEIIAVDDGSTDETGKVIKEFIRSHVNCRVSLFRIVHTGPGLARNFGAKFARGRILVRVLSLLGNRSVSAVAYHDRGETESLSR